MSFRNKFIITTVVMSILLCLCSSATVKAADDTTSSQLGFAISKSDYGQFGYIFNKNINNYYEGKIVGTTTYSYVYCRGKEKALGQYSDLCCIRVLTEPCTVKLTNKFLFIKYDDSYKFGISSLRLESDKMEYSNFILNNLKYMSSADSATVENSSGVNASLSLYGAEIEYSNIDTITKSIVDVSDKSTRTKMDIKFIFGKPSSDEQKERVYEQTYYYIMQQYLTSRSTYTNKTNITPVYACGGKTSSRTVTIVTNIGY